MTDGPEGVREFDLARRLLTCSGRALLGSPVRHLGSRERSKCSSGLRLEGTAVASGGSGNKVLNQAEPIQSVSRGPPRWAASGSDKLVRFAHAGARWPNWIPIRFNSIRDRQTN